MNIELFITNILFTISFMVSLGLGILVYVKRTPSKNSPNSVFFINSIALCIWQASYVAGINTLDPSLSRFFFMFNIAALFAVILNTDTILRITGRYESQKHIVRSFYIVAILLTVFFSLFPDQYLQLSEPKMYFPNFFVAGNMYFIDMLVFGVVLAYMYAQIYIAHKNLEFREKNRIKYFFLATLYAYSVSLVAEFLLYGINIDPITASITGLYTIPMAYGIIKYDLIGINVIAKRAFGYSLSIGSITLFILLIGYLNQSIVQTFPGFPIWVVPLLSAVVAAGTGIIVWKKVKEIEYLKYQFVDIVTHKFRTPMTHIGWSVDTLKPLVTSPEAQDSLDQIKSANDTLFELTNDLIGLSDVESTQYLYTFGPASTADAINDSVSAASTKAKIKKIQVSVDVKPNLQNIWVDKNKFQFAIQTVVDNAISYSPENTQVHIRAIEDHDFVLISVKDQGIGISKADISHIFSRFFRTDKARRIDTEGMGVGLYLSKEIMNRLGGGLFVESKGPDLGSVFTLKVPVDKSNRKVS